MKRTIALALMLVIIAAGLAACGGNKNPDVTTDNGTSAPLVTTVPVTNAPVTTAPVTTAPVTTAPVTTAAVTTAAVTTSAEPVKTVAYARELWDNAGNAVVYGAFIYLGGGTTVPQTELDRMLSFIGTTAGNIVNVAPDEGGVEWYLLIPRYKQTTVKIYELDTTSGQTGKLLCETDKPVLICCNNSDIVPSVSVLLSFGSIDLTASPALSGKDGSVVSGAGFLGIKSADIGKGK